MRVIVTAIAFASLMSAPAGATGSIECASVDETVSVSLTTGSLPVLKVVGAAIDANGQRWAMNGEGEKIAVGQAFGTGGEMRIDFTDPNIEAVVAELRLFSASEDRDRAMAGTLRIAGSGAWALSCTGP